LLCWEVEEGHEFLTIFLQAHSSFRVLCLIGFDEQIESFPRIFFGLSLSNVVYRGLGLRLRQIGKVVQHIHRFMLPAALLAGRGVNLIHGCPEAHRTVPNGQIWGIPSPAFEVEKNLVPALGGLAHPVFDRQEPFLATDRNANNYKGAKLVILAPKTTVDAISLNIDDWLVIERSVFPAVILLGPIALEARDHIRRQSRRIRPQKNLEGRAHFAAGNSFKRPLHNSGFSHSGKFCIL
jgi:hypothetical protein